MANSDKTAELASTGNVDWSVFLQEGVIVSLTIKRYRGVTTIDFSELGIDEGSSEQLKEFLNTYINLGSKKLLPPEVESQLKTIETTARQNLKDKSFDCSAFASQGKFVPKSMYADFKEKNIELQDSFFALRDSLVENYDLMIEKVRKDYQILAEKLYMQSHPDAEKPSARYVNAFTNAIVSQIPSSEEIEASFEYQTKLSRIPEYLMNVMRKKHDIDEKAMRIAASNPMPDAKASSEPEDEISKDIRVSIETQSGNSIADFITDAQIQLLTQMSEGAETIIASIDRNDGKLVGRASIKAHSLIDDVSKLNYGDSQITKLIDHFAYVLEGGADGIRDVMEVRAVAAQIKTWADKRLNAVHDETVARKTAGRKSAAAEPSAPAKPGQGAAKKPVQVKKDVPAAKKSPASKKGAADAAARPQPEKKAEPTGKKKKGATISVPKQATTRRFTPKRH